MHVTLASYLALLAGNMILPDGHPFEVGADSVHFALVEADTAVGNEGLLGVVHISSAIAVGVIRNF